VVFVAEVRGSAVSGEVEQARRVAIARAYLDSDPEVAGAVRSRREYGALAAQASTDIRDHYTAAVVQAVRSVLDARLEAVRAELAELRDAQ
jgi:hypothetical protein